jgi:hypothetical protein
MPALSTETTNAPVERRHVFKRASASEPQVAVRGGGCAQQRRLPTTVILIHTHRSKRVNKTQFMTHRKSPLIPASEELCPSRECVGEETHHAPGQPPASLLGSWCEACCLISVIC